MNIQNIYQKTISENCPSLYYKDKAVLLIALHEQKKVFIGYLNGHLYNTTSKLMDYFDNGAFLGVGIKQSEYSNNIYALDKLVAKKILIRCKNTGCIKYAFRDDIKEKILENIEDEQSDS